MSIIHSSVSALVSLRVVAAILIFIHGVARIVLDGVVPFGGFLTASHLPVGYGLAWMVTSSKPSVLRFSHREDMYGLSLCTMRVNSFWVFFSSMLVMVGLLLARPQRC